MKLFILTAGIVAALLSAVVARAGQESIVTSIDSPGRITWQSSSLNVTCHVEWAASAEGPWYRSWTNQQALFITDPSNQTDVAMVYRVVCDVPDPHVPDISAAQSLALLKHRQLDSDFVVLDVRTLGEYTTRHIIGAENIDYYAPTFADQLDALDKSKTYLMHCASGNRSGIAHDTMLSLGFHEVYNMLGGMAAFQALPGALPYLEP